MTFIFFSICAKFLTSPAPFVYFVVAHSDALSLLVQWIIQEVTHLIKQCYSEHCSCILLSILVVKIEAQGQIFPRLFDL